MTCRESLALAVTSGLLAAAPGLGMKAPVTVSPGDSEKLALIGDICPTFSWGTVAGAAGHELVVYRLAEGGEEARPVLRQSFAASVSSWTPSLDRGLERGGRYAWSVRARGREGHSEWSTPSFFQIAARPSAAEFEEALMVVRSYLAAEPEAAPTGAKAAKARPAETPAPARGPGGAGSPEPAEVTLPGPVALHAVQTEGGVSSGVVGETVSVVGGRGVWGIGSGSAGANYGVYGQSAAPLGVGVYGTGTTGVHGETGTTGGSGVYGETGAAGAYGVYGKHTDGGLAGLFDGSLKAQRATGLTGGPVVEGVVLSGLGQGVKGAGALGAWGYLGGASTGVYGETGLADGYGVYGKHTGGSYAGYFEGDLGVTGDVDISNLSCSGCVTTPAIAEGAVTEAQIADDSVHPRDIDALAWRGRLNIKTGVLPIEEVTLPREYTWQCSERDLFVMGWCELNGSAASDGVRILRSWTDTVGEWTCEVLNSDPPSAGHSVTVSLICMDL